ncbi:TPA: PerC family transcriptional regulator [Salmonella enterica subsp. indica]|uniref:PerC family transcriptional regulator n=2 Tax=Salmonella enterica TaxID=28901 RepID=A0A753A6H5_SALER|nr:PerC family transcriptional regulator [Salmonella enterica]EEA8680692.1 PerC family transcriptional regulator [Salmonella enterica subsp. enterica]EEM2503980.1 PerC family transcriptional regulator [Salmonella enterica subsp. indica serovar 45:a:e,n,x]HAF7948399.1 PerC family transcriptional regulator [Salmonella enterica subsp. indica]EBQ7680598.1 PerC family transcriptional regulator [Salmonella enterica]
MVKDDKAESLESSGLYHAAASRWLVVLNRCTSQSERTWVSQRRKICIEKATRRRQKWLLVLRRFYIKMHTYP